LGFSKNPIHKEDLDQSYSEEVKNRINGKVVIRGITWDPSPLIPYIMFKHNIPKNIYKMP
jgi:hypothetical protein